MSECLSRFTNSRSRPWKLTARLAKGNPEGRSIETLYDAPSVSGDVSVPNRSEMGQKVVGADGSCLDVRALFDFGLTI